MENTIDKLASIAAILIWVFVLSIIGLIWVDDKLFMLKIMMTSLFLLIVTGVFYKATKDVQQDREARLNKLEKLKTFRDKLGQLKEQGETNDFFKRVTKEN